MTAVVVWVALAVALWALLLARRQARRVAQLTEMYWQLKYDHGELKASIAGDPAAGAAETSRPPATPPTAFVPLAAVKRPPA